MPKTFLKYVALSTLLAAFSASVGAQTTSKKAELLKPFRSPAAQEMQKRVGKDLVRSLWSENGSNLMTMGLMNNPDIRKGLGVSDEQHRQIQQGMMKELQSHPEWAAIEAEGKKYRESGDPFMENADEEAKRKMVALQEKAVSIMMGAMEKETQKSLTDEQKRKAQEFQLASMSEFPIVTPDMFKALDLSGDQLKKMNTIREDLKPGFEKVMDDLIDAQIKSSALVFERLEREDIPIEDHKQLMEAIKTMTEKVKEDDPRYLRILGEAMDKGQAFTTQLKFKMFDVLTDEQLARLEEIVNNPPEYVQKFLEKLREQLGGRRGGAMQPMLDAWKPGEPIPEEYKKQRQRKGFPSKEE